MPDRDLQPTECLMTISGTGSYVPERVLTNADLEKMVDTTDEWITTRTGIKERRIAAAGQNTSDMATAAARRAIEMAGIDVGEIELIIVATVTPDTIFPSTACYVQKNLGATNAVAFDISAACSGFLYAMQISRHFINTGNRKTALIIGAEKLSSIVNWSDRNTCVLFGDGAGAAILRRRSSDEAVHEPRVLVTVMGTDGTLTDILNVPGGGSAIPITAENAHLRLNTVHMRGQETFKVAVTKVTTACARALELAGLDPTEIDVIVPHQANVRIIDAAAERLGIPKERAFTNIQKFGNTSAASCAIALDECHRTGVIQPGNHVLIVAFGAGFTWAASVVKW